MQDQKRGRKKLARLGCPRPPATPLQSWLESVKSTRAETWLRGIIAVEPTQDSGFIIDHCFFVPGLSLQVNAQCHKTVLWEIFKKPWERFNSIFYSYIPSALLYELKWAKTSFQINFPINLCLEQKSTLSEFHSKKIYNIDFSTFLYVRLFTQLLDQYSGMVDGIRTTNHQCLSINYATAEQSVWPKLHIHHLC